MREAMLAADACLEAETAAAFVAGALTIEARERLLAHIDGCDACRELVSLLARPSADDDAPAPASVGAVVIGTTIARRYRLLELLGAGGQGAVFVAYDAELHRNVALKLVDGGGGPKAVRRVDRLLREARTSAQLSHPNVVAIHDCGRSGELAYIAMELVDGVDLTRWLRQQPRTTAQILEVFAAAATALVAIHAKGIAHGDFKPHNVLVGRDGRVKAADFGLAVDRGPDDTPSPDDAPRGGDGSQTSGIAGTPAYMAPELLHGHTPDAASDQYAFCVSLTEALVGARPGGAASERRGRVPKSLAPILQRGLARDPSDRWRSMAELQAAITRATTTRWRTRWQLVGVLGATALGVLAVRGGEVERCTDGPAQMIGIWDDSRRDEIDAALLATGLPHAAATSRVVAQRLDAYRDEWVRQFTEACAATSVRGEASPAMLDARMRCLLRLRTGVRATLDVLAAPDVDVVRNAWKSVSELPEPAGCLDDAVLQGQGDPPQPREAEAVAGIEERLAVVEAMLEAGLWPRAREELAQVERELESVVHVPTHVRAGVLAGACELELGHFDEAEAAYRRALREAVAAGQRAALRDAALGMMMLVGEKRHRPGDVASYRDLATALTGDDADAHAELEMVEAAMAREAGDYVEAARRARRRLALTEHDHGPLDRRTTKAREHLAIELVFAGEYDEAEALLGDAIAALERSVGANHPDLAPAWDAVAALAMRRGRYGDAVDAFERSLAIVTSTIGRDGIVAATAYTNLGTALSGARRLDEAETTLRTAVTMFERVADRGGVEGAAARGSLAGVLGARARPAEAEALLRDALATTERIRGADHPDVTVLRANLATVLADRGAFAEAAVMQRAALAAQTKALGPDHPTLAVFHHNLATVLRALGDNVAAELEVRRALALDAASSGVRSGASRRLLAEVLGRQGRVEAAVDAGRIALIRCGTQLAIDRLHCAKERALLAKLLLRAGDRRAAVELAEGAYRDLSASAKPLDRAAVAFTLARARWATARSAEDRGRARALAEQAARDGTAMEPLDRAELERWLAAPH
ncbi:MAG: serine/threonine-protein kinase [Nannocystaceae bacterium]|nr:serine/threonine-protein kinase [Nannocystaceae bacterium]